MINCSDTSGRFKKQVKMMKMLIDPLQGHWVSQIEDSVSGFLHVLI